MQALLVHLQHNGRKPFDLDDFDDFDATTKIFIRLAYYMTATIKSAEEGMTANVLVHKVQTSFRMQADDDLNLVQCLMQDQACHQSAPNSNAIVEISVLPSQSTPHAMIESSVLPSQSTPHLDLLKLGCTIRLAMMCGGASHCRCPKRIVPGG